MDAAIKTAQISFPASDLALLKRLIHGMGWSISVDNEGEKKEQAENFARKICVNDEDYETFMRLLQSNLLRQKKKKSHIMIQ